MEREKKGLYKFIIVAVITVIVLSGFLFNKNNVSHSSHVKNIPEDIKWSERMAMSIMKRNPESWQLDTQEKPKWNYTQGLVLHSFVELWQKTGKQEYFEYAEKYADTIIEPNGDIETYNLDEFNIDHINPGRLLISLYQETGKEKYLKALQTLRKQLEWQPRTTDGGFWHKLRYPWQMWLDGLYMGEPFYAKYAQEFNEPECFEDIIHQFVIMEKHARDENTGLLYHGWDQSKLQRWSDPETGLSSNFWGRAMGWYAMALVDVLDYIPNDQPDRHKLIDILNRLVKSIIQYQDDSGLWYQVVDQGDRQGNYLEASASSMFVYSIAKGVNENYLPKEYNKYAVNGYEGLLNELIQVDENDGEVHITQVCAVAGLGGDPFRSGSYQYYISEKVASNDPKATGPFILASLELNK